MGRKDGIGISQRSGVFTQARDQIVVVIVSEEMSISKLQIYYVHRKQYNELVVS